MEWLRVTSAATKARRNLKDAEIVIYEKDNYISYAACGTPYYLGDKVPDVKTLAPRDPEYFKKKYNIDVKIAHEVLDIDPKNKTIKIKNLSNDKIFKDKYDKLVIATGASSVIPPIIGMENEHVFTLRNINDVVKIKTFLKEKKPINGVVVGTGFIGLEVCENLKSIGMNITMVERLPQVAPGLDKDMSDYLESSLIKNGIKIIKGASASKIEKDKVILDNEKEIDCDFVLVSVGVKPNTELAILAGAEIGTTRGIKVDEKMMTSVNDIYACGDCIEQFNRVNGKPIYRPLGTTANKTGRIAGENVSGGDIRFKGILGTGIFSVFELSVGLTGLSETSAISEGYDVIVSKSEFFNKPSYMGGKEMLIKAIADRKTGRILGAQIIGEEGVDKRLDIFVTAITFEAKVNELIDLDLAYSPQFSNPKDAVIYTGMILEKIKRSS